MSVLIQENRNMTKINNKFDIEQLVAASEAGRNFSSVRKQAKNAPRLILENNKPDSVLLSIEHFELMNQIIKELEDKIFDMKTLDRIKNIKANGSQIHKFSEFATQEDRAIFEKAKDWDISDDDLFE